MSTITINAGDQVTKDPADQKVYVFDWHTTNLAVGVTITASTFKIAGVNATGASIEQAVTSITRAAATASVTMPAAHGFISGDSITIAGAIPAAYNGTYVITVTAPTTFDYTVAGSPTTPATGTITAAAGIDEVSILAGSRTTQFRLTGGTLGAVYEIANRIRTNETPYQEKERSFRILIENQ